MLRFDFWLFAISFIIYVIKFGSFFIRVLAAYIIMCTFGRLGNGNIQTNRDFPLIRSLIINFCFVCFNLNIASTNKNMTILRINIAAQTFANELVSHSKPFDWSLEKFFLLIEIYEKKQIFFLNFENGFRMTVSLSTVSTINSLCLFFW